MSRPFQYPTLTPSGSTCYLVGGAVRDHLLGHAPGDCDYVVIGATPAGMLDAGFKPVGGDFPVFLHPKSGEEYALARTERKSGQGYHGFVFHSSPDVSLTDDLCRRDLTINAMAMDADGQIIDAHGGQRDLTARALRHVSAAFAEDPVRILRVARFAARFPQFHVAAETMSLMRQMVENGEAAHLQAERVWRELARGLTETKPSRMLSVLADCGALALVLPEVAALRGVPERLDYHPEGESFIHTQMVVDAAAARDGSEAVCFAALLHDIGKAQTLPDILPSHHGHERYSADLARTVCARLKTPREVTQLAVLAAAEHGNVHGVLDMRATTVVDLLMRVDAYRRPARLESLLRVCEADFYFLPERLGQPYPQGVFLQKALAASRAVDTGAIARAVQEKGKEPLAEKIAEAVRTARGKAVAQLIKEAK